mmetsp:Transcript_16836/g.45585  ORF Transcript_16836/g.45585 Transcript_16836/m.45585 type:complete len:81 (-) Transcript_16836:2025-2267(-)
MLAWFTVDILWATTRTVRCWPASFKASFTSCSVFASMAEVPSSSTSTGGSIRSALAMANRCFCPPEIFTFWLSPTSVKSF